MPKAADARDPVPAAHRVLQETIRISEGMESSGEPLAPTGPSPEERDREARQVMRERFRSRRGAAGGRSGS